MAYEEALLSTTCEAGANYNPNEGGVLRQYRFVRFTGPDRPEKEIEVAEGAGGLIIGVLQDKPQQGEATQVGVGGFSKLVAGAAIARGETVVPDGEGRAVPGDSSTLAWTAAANPGDVITAFLSMPLTAPAA